MPVSGKIIDFMETVHVVSMVGMFTTGIRSMGNDRDMVKYTLPMEIVGDWKDDTIDGFGKYYYSNGHM